MRAIALAKPLIAAALAAAQANPQPLALPSSARRLLETGQWDATPAGLRIVALSFLADGCAASGEAHASMRAAARSCVERCLARARQTRRGPLRPESADGLWLSHFALILGAADALGPCPDPEAHAAIALALASRTLSDPYRHVASYASAKDRWTADQAAALASLARFDRAHGAHLVDEPLRAWRDFVLSKAMDRRLGLPWSEVTGARRTSRAPRGCALSFQTRYLHEVDDGLARRFWAVYRERYRVRHFGLTGFREWPPGQELGQDLDSGPIVMGVGAAATGLGIAGARVMGDEALARELETTAAVVDAFAGGMQGARGVLPDAIRYLGAQVRP